MSGAARRSRRAVLFLCHRIPYPPNKGDKIRSWRLLQRLAARFDVHLACFIDDPADLAYRDHVAKLCASTYFEQIDPIRKRIFALSALQRNEPMSFAYFRSAAFSKAAAKLRQHDLCAEIAFSAPMAQYLETPIGGRARLVDFCDADSEKWARYAADAAWPLCAIYAREGRRVHSAETQIANWAEAATAVTGSEAALFNKRPGVARALSYWSNGVDTDYFDPNAQLAFHPAAFDLVFTGAMDYRANIEAAHWFLDHVWPVVRAAHPGVRFGIVGARPDRSLQKRSGRHGVVVTHQVADIRPYIAQAKLVVAPLRVAQGIQNKVLEGMAMARPVVASPAAAQGLSQAARAALIAARDASAFSRAISDLLENTAMAEALGVRARRAMLADYQWPHQLSLFDAILDEAMETAHKSQAFAA